MNQSGIEAALKAAFNQCEQAFCPLSDRQKEILLQTVIDTLTKPPEINHNPLDDLTPEQRQSLLDFIQSQEEQNQSWKITLLNDWLNNRDSGSVQFIRDDYGFTWLNLVQPVHIQDYLQQQILANRLLKIGDRIEVSNGLWEWVQDDGALGEWFRCQVMGISEISDEDSNYTTCIIRFENGLEFEVQGIYQWNRYNWRFPSE